MKITNIKLGEKRDNRPRPVEIHCDNGDYTLMTIPQLKELLKYWIEGEEEVYPQPKFQGRWMLFKEVEEVFGVTTR